MMQDFLGKNIARLRKQKGYTQEALANRLGVTFQAISKWENGQTHPDVGMLADLAFIFETDINGLMGYVHNKRKQTIYNDEYGKSDYYWGLKPHDLCLKLLAKYPPVRPLRVLDVGCASGKNAVFLARNGYIVTAFDSKDNFVESTKKLADTYSVDITIFKSDVNDFRLDTKYDIIFSGGGVHYIEPHLREEIFDNYKKNTNVGGIHVMSTFITKDFMAPPPDIERRPNTWKSGELFTHYTEWKIHSCEETIFDCHSSGVFHNHCANRLMAEKVL
jgi:tellurite methyltransferase